MNVMSVSEVCDVNPRLQGVTLRGDDPVAFVGMAELDDVEAVATDRERRPYAEVAKGYTPFLDGDVLVAKITPCFQNNKIGVARTSTRYAFGSTEFHVLRPREDTVDRRYLLHFLRRADVLRHGEMRMTGAGGQRRVPSRFFDELQIPLPPIEEQRRIAAVLDAADELRAKRRESLAKFDTLTQAIFIDMFGGGARPPVNPGPVTEKHPRGWHWVELPSVAILATGHTPGRRVPEYWDGHVGWVNLNEIRRLDGRWCHETELKITPAGVANSSAVILPIGTVCFSRTASIGFVTTLAAPMATSQDFVNWICGDDLRPDFLMWSLLMSREALRASSSGSTHRTIYVRDAQRFRVLLPPVELQREFERRLSELRATQETMRGSAPLMNGLFASLQQRAFRGEL